MNTKLSITKWLALIALAIFNLQPATTFAQGTTAFTYQGQLRDGGTNANGAYTMTFKLYDAVANGNQIGSTVSTSATLANGLFTVNLDFSADPFDGSARWLEITAQAGTDSPETLSPRVPLLPTPYAQYAAIAATVTNRAIINAKLAGNAVNATNIASGQVVKSFNGLKDSVTLTAGANVTLTTNGSSIGISAPLDNNPIFTGGLSLQQGTAGTTVWNLNIGNTIGSPGKSLADGLIFSYEGLPCLELGAISGNIPPGWAPSSVGAWEFDCGQLYVKDSSWNTVVSIEQSGNISTSGSIDGANINCSKVDCSGGAMFNGELVDNSDIIINGQLYVRPTDTSYPAAEIDGDMNILNGRLVVDNTVMAGGGLYVSGTYSVFNGQDISLWVAGNLVSDAISCGIIDAQGITSEGDSFFNGNISDAGGISCAFLSADGGISCNSLDAQGAVQADTVTANSYFYSDGAGDDAISSASAKTNIASMDSQTILSQVAGLSISTWSSKKDPKTQHVGPKAHDFQAAFGLGTDDKTISLVDEGGVALAAIQGLNEKLKDKDAQIEALEKRLSDLEKLVKSFANRQAGGSQ